MPVMDRVWINGQMSTHISVLDRGLTYGHGVFETLRLQRGKIILLDFHKARLQRGLFVLGIDLSLDLLFSELEQCILSDAHLQEGIVKITITAGEGGRGYRWPSPLQPTRVIAWFPHDADHWAQLETQGMTVLLSDWCLAHQPQLAGIKHLNRLDQVMARRAVDLYHCDEGLLLDEHQHVIEGTSTNLFIYAKGAWITPRLNLCGVQGVMRQHLLTQIMPLLGHACHEQIITPEDLYQADEIFLSNILGIFPVVALTAPAELTTSLLHTWSIGPRTQQCQQAIHAWVESSFHRS